MASDVLISVVLGARFSFSDVEVSKYFRTATETLKGPLHSGEAEGSCILTDRVGFITHHKKQILLVDLSNCSGSEVAKIVRAVPELVTTRPPNSVLLLSDFTGASFDEEAVRVMKEAAVFDKPFIKKTAWVGAEFLPNVFSESIRSFSRREFPSFETREEALAWLVKD
jgi:hypothetical protein